MGGVTGYPGFTQERAVLATFGKPVRTYHVGSYTVLVWNGNLLSDLRHSVALPVMARNRNLLHNIPR